MSNNVKKEKIVSFDFIRAVCTIGIVLFHYSFNYIEYNISGSHLVFNKFHNSDWGSFFVAIFFMLSGAVLWYNYGEKINVPTFYFRRYLSIFPMFYLTWIIAYVNKVTGELNGFWFYAGSKRKFIQSVLGIDGYLFDPYTNINYYQVGEWFLGAILILYLLFPVFRLLFKRYEKTGIIFRIIFTAVLFIAYTLNLYHDWFRIHDGKNLLTASMNFWIGMIIMDVYCSFEKKLEENNKKIAGIVAGALVLALVFMLVPVGLKEVMSSTFSGTCIMVAFLYLGKYIMKVKLINITAQKLSAWSFGIFLVHHIILYAFMKQFQGTEVNFLKSCALFVVVMLIISVAGAIVSLWGTIVTKLFRKK